MEPRSLLYIYFYLSYCSIEENNFCFVVKNIDSKVVRDKLWEVFSDFGTVTQVEMNTEIWAAAVIYA